MLIHTQQVMSRVRVLRIEEIGVNDTLQDFLELAAAIKQTTNLSPKLKTVEIGEFCLLDPPLSMQRLSIENILELQSAYHLQRVVLTHLKVPDHQNVVSFLRHHAPTLIHAELKFVELMDEKYITFVPEYTGKTMTDVGILSDGLLFSTYQELPTFLLCNGSLPTSARTGRA